MLSADKTKKSLIDIWNLDYWLANQYEHLKGRGEELLDYGLTNPLSLPPPFIFRSEGGWGTQNAPVQSKR